jgi:hypothetical protein
MRFSSGTQSARLRGESDEFGHLRHDPRGAARQSSLILEDIDERRGGDEEEKSQES